MDDMGTPGPNHPAYRGLKGKRTEGQFDNVFNLEASRKIKKINGKTVPIKLDTTKPSAEEDAHWNTVIREDK